VAALGDEDVRGLDVAVDDPFGVRGIERVGNLDCEPEEHIGLDGFARDAMPQRHAVEKLHDDEGMAIFLPNLMDGTDIGMIQRRSRLRLALKPRQGLGVFDDVIGQEFQRDKSVEGYILCLVDDPHSAAAQFLDDAVVRYRLADH